MNNKYIVMFVLLFTFAFAGWEPQISGTNVSLNDVYFPNDTLTGYICGDSGIILKTTNSGNDWIRQNTPVTTKLNAIYFIGDTGWSVGSEFTTLSTTNGGITWSGTSTPGGLTLHDIYFSNDGFGIIIGESGFCMITWDNGRTWQVIMMPIDITLRSIFFVNASIAWIVGSNSTCLKTTNGGNTWDSILIIPSGTFWDIYFIDELIGYITCDHGNVQKTTNGGEVWELFTVAPVTISLHSIDFLDNETDYICGSSGFVCELGGPYTIINPLIDLHSINFPVPMVGWTIGSHGSIYKTSDGMAVTEKINKKDFSSISYFPNPFTDFLTLKIPANERMTKLRSYNALGKVIIDKEFNNGFIKLNCKSITKGVYFIKAKNTITQVIKI